MNPIVRHSKCHKSERNICAASPFSASFIPSRPRTSLIFSDIKSNCAISGVDKNRTHRQQKKVSGHDENKFPEPNHKTNDLMSITRRLFTFLLLSTRNKGRQFVSFVKIFASHFCFFFVPFHTDQQKNKCDGKCLSLICEWQTWLHVFPLSTFCFFFPSHPRVIFDDNSSPQWLFVCAHFGWVSDQQSKAIKASPTKTFRTSSPPSPCGRFSCLYGRSLFN